MWGGQPKGACRREHRNSAGLTSAPASRRPSLRRWGPPSRGAGWGSSSPRTGAGGPCCWGLRWWWRPGCGGGGGNPRPRPPPRGLDGHADPPAPPGKGGGGGGSSPPRAGVAGEGGGGGGGVVIDQARALVDDDDPPAEPFHVREVVG